jgi:hypothetical protein
MKRVTIASRGGSIMRTKTAVVLGALALALAAREPARLASPAGVQLADMGMGELGPELGGSQDDMILNQPGQIPAEADMVVDDPGRVPPPASDMDVSSPGQVPPEANMVVDDPGRLPPQPSMDIEQPQDLDADDDID